ncbi:MAG: hypothetical protein AAF703_01135 [Cyanobacteria bacterium P01_D01_bin.105]
MQYQLLKNFEGSYFIVLEIEVFTLFNTVSLAVRLLMIDVGRDR